MSFYIEKPADKWYNVGMWSKDSAFPYPVIEAEKIDDHTLRVIAPERIAHNWPTLHPRFYVEVPSFMAGMKLSYEQYVALFPDIQEGWSDVIMRQLEEISKTE